MLKILKVGTYSTIQDFGRFGHKKFGVPVAGAMDKSAMINANRIVGNKENEAVIEFMLQGPEIEFQTEVQFALTGCQVDARLNDKLIQPNLLYTAKSGDYLSLSRIKNGLCGYLAVRGGFVSETVLGSKSYYPHITTQATLCVNQHILLANEATYTTASYNSGSKENETALELWKGPEFQHLSAEQKSLFFTQSFKLTTQFSRMGFRTEGISALGMKEIITSSVQPGTLQVTPSGQLILLMRDAPTTGGYARLGQLETKSIDKIAQKRPNETISFKLLI